MYECQLFWNNVHSENSMIENSFPVSHEFVLVLGLNQLTIPKEKESECFSTQNVLHQYLFFTIPKEKNQNVFQLKMFFINIFFYIDIVSTLKHPARSSSRVVFVQPGFQQRCERCPVGFFQKGLYIQFRRLVDEWTDGEGQWVRGQIYVWMDG